MNHNDRVILCNVRHCFINSPRCTGESFVFLSTKRNETNRTEAKRKEIRKEKTNKREREKKEYRNETMRRWREKKKKKKKKKKRERSPQHRTQKNRGNFGKKWNGPGGIGLVPRARRLVIHLDGSSTRQAQLQPRQKTAPGTSSFFVRRAWSVFVARSARRTRALVFSSLSRRKRRAVAGLVSYVTQPKRIGGGHR